MKKMKKVFSGLLLSASCVTLAFGAVPVFAETDEATKEIVAGSVDNFLSQVYTLDDSQMQQLEQEGGFYEVLYESWQENKDIVGDFVEVESTDVEDYEDDQLLATSMVKFKNYEAEVLLYFDEDQTPTNYVMNVQYPMSELMAQAGENMAVGLITVFAVLAILIIIMLIEGKIFVSIDKKKKSKKARSDAQESEGNVVKRLSPSAAPSAAAGRAGTASASGTASDTEIAAVIAAAIAAAMEDEPAPGGYVVRSIRKVGTRRWKRV